MKKSLLEIYALAVCFFTVACFVIVLGIALWDGIQIAAPEFTLNSYEYERHQSDEAYREQLVMQNRCVGVEMSKREYQPPEGEALSLSRQESYARVLRQEARSGLQSLARNLIILVIDLLVFLLHWAIAGSARRSAA